MQLFCESMGKYKRLKTKEVTIGGLKIGNGHPIAIQTMTTADTMDTQATIDESIRCIQAGAQLVRITAPSKKEAQNLQAIKDGIRAAGYDTPLVADIHFTPNAAEIAAKIVEKVRVNPGNYADKKKFETHEYTDASYQEELARIREKFIPLVKICKEHSTAMRIGTNHGSLSDRIMSRFGDTAIGMVESALEFLRIARSEDYHNIVLSMKSSNAQVMVQAYRLLVQKMNEEFGECYPLHLGVTEAGDGEDGRIKSAVGIGTLLKDGLGDTIRVSLTEDPEFELPVCSDLINECANDPPPNPLQGGGSSLNTNSDSSLENWKNNIIPYNKNLKEKARKMRNEPTASEAKLWQHLKGKQILSFDFDRQKPINEFIVDFYCRDLKLVVVIDGSIHDNEEAVAYDTSREKILNDLGLNVLRFTNTEVEKSTSTVLDKLKEYALAYEKNTLETITGINPLSKHKPLPPLERGLGGEFKHYNPFEYKRRKTTAVKNIGGTQVPVVVGDYGKIKNIRHESLQAIGYTYNVSDDKWNVSDFAADYLFAEQVPDFNLPGTLSVITWYDEWKEASDKTKVFPYLTRSQYLSEDAKSNTINFVDLGAHESLDENFAQAIQKDPTVVLVLYSADKLSMKQLRGQMLSLVEYKIEKPVIFIINSKGENGDQHLIHYATEAGALLLDGFGDGLILGVDYSLEKTLSDVEQANLNSFGILQATRCRISKTEYISCPSCGRTLFDLQETTAKIRARTNHLKGVKIGIMGCIVNGPGEMADADFGYVGSGVGKITLYKGQEVVKRAIPSEVAVDELINLIKENDAWVEPSI